MARSSSVDTNNESKKLPHVASKPITQRGDVWLCGPHRVMCGDATQEKDLRRLMQGTSADLLILDPPYGMQYAEAPCTTRQRGVSLQRRGRLKGDDLNGEALLEYLTECFKTVKGFVHKEAAWYVCHTWRTQSVFKRALNRCGKIPGACLIWNKGSMGLGMMDYRPQYESIWYCAGTWYGGRAQSDVWTIARDGTKSYRHPTQKPVALMEAMIKSSSCEGNVVFDPFAGGGATLLACERLGRRALCLDCAPQYVDVIVRRWQQRTGKDAVRASDKQTFNASRRAALP